MNKVTLLGRLAKDPEMRYTSTNNIPVCNFTLAVNRRFQRQGEERQADFFPIVVWDKLADFCGKYFTKGRQVAIVGRLQTRSWDDKDGQKRYVTEIVAEEAYFADSKKDNNTEDSTATTAQAGGFFPVEDDNELPF